MGGKTINGVQAQFAYPQQAYANLYSTYANSDADFIGNEAIGGQAVVNGTAFGGNSIFNPMAGGMAYNPMMGMGMNPMMGCYGKFPGSEIYNMDLSKYGKYNLQLQKENLDNDVALKRAYSGARFKNDSMEDTVSRRCAVIQRMAKENNQDFVYNEYKNLLKISEEKLAECGVEKPSEEQKRAYAEKLYAESTGSSMLEDLTASGDSQFAQGLKQGALFGLGKMFTNKRNYEDNIKSMTGEEPDPAGQTWNKVGQATSWVITAGVAALALKFGAKGVGRLFKAGART